MQNKKKIIPGLVSVIMPAYNHEKYVMAAIQSVLEQTWHPIELLVLDDGSSDNTWAEVQQIKDRCQQRFVRIKFWQQENKGICETLNALLAEAEGEYISRLDSDDLYKPWAIEKFKDFLDANTAYGFVVGDNELIDENGDTVYWTKKRRNTKDKDEAIYYSFGDYLKKLRPEINFESDDFGEYFSFLRGNYVGNGYLIRKTIIDNFRFTNSAPQEDHYMLMQIAKLSLLKYLDIVCHCYRWHSSNNIKRSTRMWNFARMTMRHELELLKEAGDENVYKKAEDILTETRRKTKLSFGPFEIYKNQTFFEKGRYILRIGSREITLMTKS